MPSQRNFCSRVEFAEVFVEDADGTFTAPVTGHKDKVAIGAGEEVSAAVVLGVGGNLVPQIVPLLRFFDVSGGGVGEVEGIKEGLWFVEVAEGIIAVRCKLGGYSGPGGDAIVGVVTPGVGVNGALRWGRTMCPSGSSWYAQWRRCARARWWCQCRSSDQRR